MMESCFPGIPKRVGPVQVEDIKRNLLGELEAVEPQTENLQVYLRVRPFTAAESHSGESQDCVTIEGSNTVVLKAPRFCQPSRQGEKSLPQTAQRFTFTQVFSPEASQRSVFEGSVRGLVQDVLQGGNCLVFTYGVTNAGKTFTFLGPDHNSGLLPRSLSVIFNSMEGHLYGRCDLKPQRCRDFSRLTPDQQAAEMSSKKNLLRMLKENDKSLTAGKSASLEGSSISSDSSMNSVSEADSFCLDVPSNVRFSVWVSFCEIYNENIHDLLEQVPGGQQKRTVLRLSQDVKGNSFIKDLRWIQVNSSEEAYKVMKIGKRNQSLSATRLNNLSSRSHSIFSIRILRIDEVGVPRVLSISELALCDLAGSERCSRTHNTGERLKEAGNINGSLLTLGKCINAIRLNQNAKFQHHVPFRESKLTHFLQFFFCGSGRVSMVVNINQNSSCFDETLNVLKFCALAQKVVVVNTRPVALDNSTSHKSAMELSLIIDEADQHRNVLLNQGRRSSLVAWETSLEDVQEAEDSREEEEEEEESVMEGTVLEAGGEEEEDGDQTMEEEAAKSGMEAALRLVLEAQIREEVSNEFMELFNKMEKDYSERLEKEREILEERAERRVEILKNLVSKTVDLTKPTTDNCMEGIISSMTEDLKKIRDDAQSVQHCLSEQTHAAELEALRLEKLQTHEQLQEAMKSLQHQQQKLSEMSEFSEQKDEAISRLQESLRNAQQDRPAACSCGKRTVEDENEEQRESSKRQRADPEQQGGGAAKKRVVLEEEIWRLQEENDKKEEKISELRRRLEEELRRREEEVEELKNNNLVLEKKVHELTDLDECLNCDSLLSSLEVEQKETKRLEKENKALVNGMFQLQTEMTALQMQLKQQTNSSDGLLKQLDLAKSRLQLLENQLEERARSIKSLTEEVECLRQEVKQEEAERRCVSVLHAAMEELKKKSDAAEQSSAQIVQQMGELQREKQQLEERLAHSNSSCMELRQQLENQRAQFSQQLQNLKTELESDSEAPQQRVQDEEELEVAGLQRGMLEEKKVPEDSGRHTDTQRRELQSLKEKVHRREEEKENQTGRRLHGRRKEEEREPQLHRDAQDVSASPLRSNMADRRKLSKTVKRKRKSSEVEGLAFSENKRNRVKGRARSSNLEEGVLQKIDPELIQNCRSIPISKADPAVSKETVATAKRARRGRKKLFKVAASSPLLDSPHAVAAGNDEDKESDHLIIRRQLRSCRK